jgi:hypothetical protein
MKNFSYLVPHLPQPATPHATECLAKIKAMLTKPEPKPVIEREPGSDDE